MLSRDYFKQRGAKLKENETPRACELKHLSKKALWKLKLKLQVFQFSLALPEINWNINKHQNTKISITSKLQIQWVETFAGFENWL